MRKYSQVKTRQNLFITVENTAWLYPIADINTALATTTFSYTYDGDFITCPDLTTLKNVYSDIYGQTTVSQPIGNVGYSIGVGTLLEDMGQELRFRLTSGQVIIVWRLVKQLTPQSPATVIPNPGNSPNLTVGYITTFVSYGNGTNGGYVNNLDDVQVLRLG
jgi:hypothetical protein